MTEENEKELRRELKRELRETKVKLCFVSGMFLGAIFGLSRLMYRIGYLEGNKDAYKEVKE